MTATPSYVTKPADRARAGGARVDGGGGAAREAPLVWRDRALEHAWPWAVKSFVHDRSTARYIYVCV
jgi:hypothetical protein